MSSHEPIGGRLFTAAFGLLLVIAAVGFVILGQRFMFGLGAVTNINDGYPWGIWVVIDVVVGTAFGCGGFAMALLVYILNKGEYHPLMRPALLAGLFGYTLGGMAVIIDLGRYWQVYNIFLPWYAQPNSVMFEVALCVTAYIVVLWIEFSPAFFEKFQAPGLKKLVKSFMFLVIALGVLLPTMHQSSLGTMLVILGHQLSPLWQTNLLPLLFLISALGMGYAIVAFEAVLASLAFKRPLETPILARLGGVMFGVIVAFIVLRLGDLALRGALGLAFQGGVKGGMFMLETLLFVAAAMLLATPSSRATPRHLFLGALAMLLAGTIYRINGYLVGYETGMGWTYFPSVPELLVTLGIFALEVVLYLIFVKKLPVLHRLHKA
jgi:Ni/Fe-hydrogenase subunit HybB-like protein